MVGAATDEQAFTIEKGLHVLKSRIFKLTPKKCRNLSLSIRAACFGLVKPVSNFSYWSIQAAFPESIF